jgi:dGTPase
MAEQERQLKRFMYKNLYHHPVQIAAAENANIVIRDLYAAYIADDSLLPEEWRAALPQQEPERSRHITDFLAGMTDRYAQNRHDELTGAA